jgi:hypothetical protein
VALATRREHPHCGRDLVGEKEPHQWNGPLLDRNLIEPVVFRQNNNVVCNMHLRCCQHCCLYRLFWMLVALL